MTSTSDARRRRLQRLLVAARAQIDPAEFDLSRPRDPRGKKAPGLTQSQVARALGCSTETYNRFECSRGSAPTSEFLQRVAEILLLSEYQWREMWVDAVGHGPPWPLHPGGGLAVPDIWRHVLHQLETMAFLSNAAWEVLEYNDAFAAMFPGGQPPSNMLRWMLLDHQAREGAMLDWKLSWGPALISQLITARGAHPSHPALEQIEADVRADAIAGPIYRGDADTAFTQPDAELPLRHATLGRGWARLAPAEPLDSPGTRVILLDFRAKTEPTATSRP